MQLSTTFDLPPLPARAAKAPPPDRYRVQYGVILLCADEADQAAVHDALKDGPRKVRVVTT